MSYVNIPPNLQDMFYSLLDRIAKLETGPNGAQTTADGAQSTATAAASAAAAAASTASTAIQKDSYNIFNASNQLTAINGNGVTVYTGASPTTGPRVVLNSAGLAASNGTVDTFSISASTGNASFYGVITATGGNIGGWGISPTQLEIPSIGNYIKNTGAAMFTSVSTNSGSSNVFAGTIFAGADIQVYGGFSVYTNPSTFNTNSTFSSYIYYPGRPTTTSSANVFINNTTGLLAQSTSSLRYKVEVQEQDIPNDSVLALTSKSFIDKAQYEENGQKSDGLQRILGLIAEEVAEIPVLGDLLVNRNEQGQPDSVNYDRVAVALIPLIKELHNRVTVLEGK